MSWDKLAADSLARPCCSHDVMVTYETVSCFVQDHKSSAEPVKRRLRCSSTLFLNMTYWLESRWIIDRVLGDFIMCRSCLCKLWVWPVMWSSSRWFHNEEQGSIWHTWCVCHLTAAAEHTQKSGRTDTRSQSREMSHIHKSSVKKEKAPDVWNIEHFIPIWAGFVEILKLGFNINRTFAFK